MKQLLAVLLCLTFPLAAFAGDTSYKVTYDGGSLSDIKSGTGVHLFIHQDNVRFVRDGKEIANIPASAITEITYPNSEEEAAWRSSLFGWCAGLLLR